jgi:probable HAF family extracellular repeat protein
VTANAVNDQGIVVGDYQGYCTPDCGSPAQAWMYQQSSGALNELTFDPSETYASANGISNSGIIAGSEGGPQSAGQVPVFWTTSGGAMSLTGCASCWAVAANDGGTIVGQFGDSGSPGSAALMWTPPGYAQTSLPGLECDYCDRLDISITAINDSGTAVGSSLSSVYSNGQRLSGGLFAVEWQGGTATSLGSLQDSGTSAAYGINNPGDIVGSSRVGASSGAPAHAFLYHQGAMIDLGTLQGDTDSSAASINDGGQIVGQSENTTLNDSSRAFLYENGQMYDLNSLIDPADPLAGSVTLQAAVSISSNGWIAVNGTDSRDPGSQRAFLLIPSG